MKYFFITPFVILLSGFGCKTTGNHSTKTTLTTNDSEFLYTWSLKMYERLSDPKSDGSDSDKWKVYSDLANNIMPANHFPPFIQKRYQIFRTNDSSIIAKVKELNEKYGYGWPKHYVDTFYHEYTDSEFGALLLTGKYEPFYWFDTTFVYPKGTSAYFSYLFQHPRAAPTIKENSAFNYSSLVDMNGRVYDEESLKNKVVVINYWFINCVPCREEMPLLNSLVAKYKNNPDVVFLGIAPDSKERLRTALNSFRFDYHIIPDSGPFLDSLHLDGYPSHEVIDKNGKIVFSCTESGDRTLSWLIRVIEQCLADKS
jgi:thiol-disulfide isomerase/thioredoxin